jgi:predicted  nucleic acid-binding Zn-ribbon protein
MATPAEVLKEIHRLRRYLTDLQNRINQLPKRKGSLKGIVEHQEKKLADAQAALKHLKVKAHQDDVTLKGTTDQIAKYQGQLNQIMSKKEFDALQHEITHGKEQVSKLEDQILQTLTEIDESTARLPALEKELQQARQELADFDKDSQLREGELTAELAKVKMELTETEASLPEGDLRVQYERLLRQRGDDSFASVRQKTCQACYMEVTSQMSNELNQGRFVLCKSCGRILYLAEQGGS